MKHLRLFLALFTLLIGGASASAQGWIPQAPADGDFYLYNVGTGKYLSCGSEYWGTKACIDNGGLNFTLANNGSGAYTIYSTSTFSFGNPNSAQLQSSGYVDQNVTATTWTFSPVNGMENTYTMQNATGTYLCAPSDGTKSILLNETQPTDEFGYWKLINSANLFPETASAENPVDVTCLIGDANFESCNNKMESFWTIAANNNNLVKPEGGSHVPNNALESWQSSFTLSQSITVPNGYYRLQAQAFIREYNETGDNYPVVYINDATKPFKKMVTATAALEDVEKYFINNTDDGYYTGWTDVVSVTDKKITIGARGTRTDTWCVWDNFQLQYLGPLDLSEFVNGLAAAVSAAEATQGTIPTACYDAISAVVTQYNQSYDNADDYTEAIQAINNAVAQYASPAIVAAYSNYITIRTAVLDIDNNINLTQADNLANDGTDANLEDAIQAARDALMNYLPNSDGNIDLTAAMLTNPGFELGNVNGWTNSGSIEANAQGNNAFDNKQGNYYAERWHVAGTVDLNQTVSNLAAGVYEIGAYLYTDTNDGRLYANETKTNFNTSGWYTVQVAVDANGSITFGASCTLTNSTWICMDGFSLKYIGGLPDLTAVEGKMNNDVASAQSSAIETYNANRTTANYNAAVAAIAAAQASVNAYVKAKTAIDKAYAIKENHNLATAAAATTFAEAIANIENPYNEGTLTDDAANNAGITLGTAVSNWHANNNAPAVVYLRDGYALGDFLADPALHVNTWSTEGDSDGSNFSVPFYESWLPETNSLPESTITGSLTELPNGLYKVTAWVRVRAKNGVNATEATGITLDVNGGTAEDVTEGSQVGTSQFALDTYEAEGLVKDGNLYVNFNIAADNNISWLSFQNVKYEKVRDLTPEEEFVEATPEDYAALNAAIAAKPLGFEEGEYAPYNNVESIAALNAAKAIDPSALNSQEDVQAATAALENANWVANTEEVNGIFDGNFAIQEVPKDNTRPIGWQRDSKIANQQTNDDTGYHTRLVVVPSGATSTNKGMMTKHHAFYGEQTGYTLPLKANTTYELKFKYAGWNNKPTMHINIYNEEGTKVAASSDFTAKSNNGHNSADGWAEYYYVFTTTDAGNYVIGLIKNTGATQQNQAGFGDMSLFKVKQKTVTIKKDFAGTTYSSENALDFTNSGLTAYIITDAADGKCITTEVTKVPAGTGVYVEGEAVNNEADTHYTVNVYGGSDYSDVVGNLLVGTGAQSKELLSDASFTYYMFGKQNGKESFFKVGTETKRTASAHKAYLAIPGVSNAKAFVIVRPNDDVVSEDGGFADGINNVEQDGSNAKIYNLNGQRVNNAQKGIYIKSGKKVIIK